MRILMLAHRMPYPPTTGDKVRAYHIARHLARNHKLTLAFLVDDRQPAAALAALRNEIPDISHAAIARRFRRISSLLRLLGGGSATIAYFDSPPLRTQVSTWVRNNAFDLLYVSSSSMAPYIVGARVPIIMDFVDVDSDKWFQYGARLPFHKAWVYRLEGKRLRQRELWAAQRAAHCLVATRPEQALLHSFAAGAPTTVVPNGVDLAYFTPAAVSAPASTIVCTGAMDYFPNVDAVLHFAHQILPQIQARIPEARFLVVGKNPTSAIRRLATLPGVHVTGSVPDVRPYLRQAAVAVAPLRIARGVQNKVLEAMAMGLAVVASTKAHEGLEARNGLHLFVQEDPCAFAETVVRLLRTVELRTEVGRAARQFVETHHSWPASMDKVDQVISDVVYRPVAAGIGMVGE